MKTPIEKIQVLRQEEFEKTNTSRVFPVGTQIQITDNGSVTTQPYLSVYEYSQAGVALQQYGVFALYNAGSSIVAGISTSPGTAVGCYRVIVPQTNVAANSYFWGAVRGICTAAVTYSGAGIGVIPGSQLRVAGNATYASPHTVSKSAETAPNGIRMVNSIGFVSGLSATSSNAVNIYLYGDNVMPNQIAIWAGDNTML